FISVFHSFRVLLKTFCTPLRPCLSRVISSEFLSACFFTVLYLSYSSRMTLRDASSISSTSLAWGFAARRLRSKFSASTPCPLSQLENLANSPLKSQFFNHFIDCSFQNLHRPGPPLATPACPK